MIQVISKQAHLKSTIGEVVFLHFVFAPMAKQNKQTNTHKVMLKAVCELTGKLSGGIVFCKWKVPTCFQSGIQV